MLIGIGSAVFHPESSRVARIASGGRFGTAQSLFQLGGNGGQALGPLLAAFIVVPLGRPAVAWFAVAAALGAAILWQVGSWAEDRRRASTATPDRTLRLPRATVIRAIAVLAVLVFTKNIYSASMSSYFTFFTIDKFGLSTQGAQIMLFLFLLGMAGGVMLGGIIGDRVGPLTVIWVSILGALPLTLALPHVGLVPTGVLAVLIGLVLASAFRPSWSLRRSWCRAAPAHDRGAVLRLLVRHGRDLGRGAGGAGGCPGDPVGLPAVLGSAGAGAADDRRRAGARMIWATAEADRLIHHRPRRPHRCGAGADVSGQRPSRGLP